MKICCGTLNWISAIPVGNLPTGVAVTPDGTRVYVANDYDDIVSVIDTANNTVTAAIGVGSGPNWIAIGAGIGPPINKNQCKKGGWQAFTIPRKFKNLRRLRQLCKHWQVGANNCGLGGFATINGVSRPSFATRFQLAYTPANSKTEKPSKRVIQLGCLSFSASSSGSGSSSY